MRAFSVGNVHFLEEIFEYQKKPIPTPHLDLQQLTSTSEMAPRLYASLVGSTGETTKRPEEGTKTLSAVESDEQANPNGEEWSEYPVLFSYSWCCSCLPLQVIINLV